MKTLDYTKPHLRFATYKFTTDENGIEHKERTFVLVPMKAKPKTKLTKEQVSNKKAARVYVSTGISEQIPYDDTVEDNEKHWGELKLGKQVIADYRAWKKAYDEATTEIITLANGFKQKIKVKLEFKPKPSMKLSPDERNTRMEEHKKSSKALRIVKTGRNKAFRDNPKPYVYEGYTSTTKARKERQEKLEIAHNEKIIGVIAYLKNRKQGVTLRIEKILKKEETYTSKTFKPKVPFSTGMQFVQKAVRKNKAKDAVHVFGVDRKDNVPAIGMKIAA